MVKACVSDVASYHCCCTMLLNRKLSLNWLWVLLSFIQSHSSNKIEPDNYERLTLLDLGVLY